jgi:hypothetical protein
MTKLPRHRSTSRRHSSAFDVRKIGKLIRLLGSDKAGEVVAAAAALRRSLAAGGRDLHDLAEAAEAGLQHPHTRLQPRTSWSPPLPSLRDWQAMAWYAHYHADILNWQEREFVADMLLGQGEGFDDGAVCDWALRDLRSIVGRLQAPW